MDKDCHLCCKVRPPKQWAARTFTPATYGYTGDLKDIGVLGHDDCVTYLSCPRTDEKELCCDRCKVFKPKKHESTILVSFDATWKKNNNYRPSVGVWFASGSPHNTYEVQTVEVKSQHRTALLAAVCAIDHLKDCLPQLEHHQPINRVILQTDSNRVVRGITQDVYEWEKNNWQGSTSHPIVNRDLWQSLVSKVRTLEELGVQILFWHVHFDLIRDATNWAHLGYDVDDLRKRAQAVIDGGGSKKSMIMYRGQDWCCGCLLDVCGDEEEEKEEKEEEK